jgi:hypothetical protein
MARREKRDVSQQVAKLDEEFLWVGYHFDELPGDAWVTEIRMKFPDAAHLEFMAVVKGVVGETAVVAFVSAPALDLLAHLVAAKLMNGTMSWREDRPYEGR